MADISTSIIVGQGEINEQRLRSLSASLPLIALDGAADYLASLSLTPQIIIGDMDSCQSTTLADPSGEIIAITEQDSNDFEKALYHLSPEKLVGFGLFGKRFDQAMANLHVMAKYHDSTKVIAITPDEIITVHKGPVTLAAENNALIAVIALQPMRFATSENLRYQLDGLSLGFGQMISSSNEALSSQVRIIPDTHDNAGYYAVCRPLSMLDKMAVDAL